MKPLPAKLLPAALALSVAALCAAPAPARAQGQGGAIGAYFTVVNTYFYAKAPHDGKRFLVRPRQAFTVVDVALDANDTRWFQVIFPTESNRIAGTGWTPNAPHELLAAPQEPVLVFSRIPGADRSGLSVVRVPGSTVELLNETQGGSPFLQVDWQKVRYQADVPLRAWARDSAGIYRPGKTPGFMTRVYAELVTRNVEKEEQTRLLSGIVRVGDDPRLVRWALGDPLRTQEETVGTAHRTIWQFPELTVTFENSLVKQIN